MDADEPDDLDRQLEQDRRALDDAHARLMSTIRTALDQGRGPSRVARHAGWTREYISKIRDGDAGGPLRRRGKS
jgi:DNA-binding phage protein